MKVTLKRLSEETGVSISTISRLMTGKGYVSAEARKTIEDAMQRLNFTPPEKPIREPRFGEDTVLLIIGGLKTSTSSDILEDLVAELELKHKKALICVGGFQADRELEYLRMALECRFFGVIMLTVIETPEMIATVRRMPCPVVFLGRYLPSIDTDCLHPDYYKMGYMAAEYLFNHGHRRIGFIGAQRTSSITQDKFLGMSDYLSAQGFPLTDNLVMHNERMLYQNGRDAAQWLLNMDRPPTAIFSSTDMSGGIVDELLNAGVSLPRDLSIFSCDNTPTSATNRVPLTLVCADYHAIVMETLKILFRRHRNPNMPRNLMLFNPVLVERSSVTAPRTTYGFIRSGMHGI